MSSLLLRGWNWCRRFRKRCGYGVHSPSDFFLITFVIYEKLPFYAYDRLKKMRYMCSINPEHREKVDKLLFRLVNHLQPEFMLEIGTGTGVSTAYMAEGNKKMRVITCYDELNNKMFHVSECRNDIKFKSGGIDEFISLLEKSDLKPDIIHISNTDKYKVAFEVALSYVSSKTCIVVSLPYASKEKKAWWNSVVEDERTGVTFDLYDIGLVFFDSKRIKEHRVVNFL